METRQFVCTRGLSPSSARPSWPPLSVGYLTIKKVESLIHERTYSRTYSRKKAPSVAVEEHLKKCKLRCVTVHNMLIKDLVDMKIVEPYRYCNFKKLSQSYCCINIFCLAQKLILKFTMLQVCGYEPLF